MDAIATVTHQSVTAAPSVVAQAVGAPSVPAPSAEAGLIGPDVLDALRQGERWAWERAYGVYARRLATYLSFRFGGPEAASAAVSETFVRALDSCADVRGDPRQLPVWFFRIARRVADDAAQSAPPAAGISPAEQEVLVLRLCAGLSSTQIARVVGRRTRAVRMQQLHALEALAGRTEGL